MHELLLVKGIWRLIPLFRSWHHLVSVGQTSQFARWEFKTDSLAAPCSSSRRSRHFSSASLIAWSCAAFFCLRASRLLSIVSAGASPDADVRETAIASVVCWAAAGLWATASGPKPERSAARVAPTSMTVIAWGADEVDICDAHCGGAGVWDTAFGPKPEGGAAWVDPKIGIFLTVMLGAPTLGIVAVDGDAESASTAIAWSVAPPLGPRFPLLVVLRLTPCCDWVLVLFLKPDVFS